MTKIEFTGDAERDLIDLYLHGIERFGLAQAERYSKTLHDKIETVAENPSFGADYSFVREGLRRYESVSHAIYYQRTAKGIRVLRILVEGLSL